MNRKWSTAALLITGIVGLGVGYLLLARLNPVPVLREARGTVKAVINIKTADKSCQQYAGSDFGHVVKWAFPDVSKDNGQAIVWHGQIDGGPPNQKVHVEFPAGQSPFSKDKFDKDDDSGPVLPGAEYKDYPFSGVANAVMVGDLPCNSFTDPGVHVTQ